MFRKKLSIKNISLFMACLFLFFAVYSCTNDKMDIANPQSENETIELDSRITETGQMHNEIVLRFILEVVPRYGSEKVPYEVGKEEFIRIANQICAEHGLSYRVDEHWFKGWTEQIVRMKREQIYDFTLETENDFAASIDKLVNEGSIKQDAADQAKEIINRSLERSEEQGPYLVERGQNACVAIEIYNASAILWAEEMDSFVEENPELESWWDDWKKSIREICLIGSDLTGALVASSTGPVGTLIGGALASTAFTIAWPPY